MPTPSPAALAARFADRDARQQRYWDAKRVHDPAEAEVMAYDEAIYSLAVRTMHITVAEKRAHKENDRRAVNERSHQLRLEAKEAGTYTRAAEMQEWVQAAQWRGMSLEVYLKHLIQTAEAPERDRLNARITQLRRMAANHGITLTEEIKTRVSARQYSLGRREATEHLPSEQRRRHYDVLRARKYAAHRAQMVKQPSPAERTRRRHCPHPGKIAYVNEPVGQLAAQLHVDDLRADGFARDVFVYDCSCGWLHVGHSKVSLLKRTRIALNS